MPLLDFFRTKMFTFLNARVKKWLSTAQGGIELTLHNQILSHLGKDFQQFPHFVESPPFF